MSIDRPAHDGARATRLSTGRRVLIGVGTLLLLGGLAAVVIGFGSFVGAIGAGGGEQTVLSDDTAGIPDLPDQQAAPEDTTGGDLALFAGGGLVMVVGLGVIAFTRVSSGSGGYSRVTIEHGVGPGGGWGGGGARGLTGGVAGGLSGGSARRRCESCGRENGEQDTYCGGCGRVLG